MPRTTAFFISLCSLLVSTVTPGRSEDWPQWQGPRADGIWRDAGIVATFPAGGPPVRWRVPVGAALALFLGTAAVCAAILVTSLAAPASSGMLESAGAALYLLGVFGVTMTVNVPLNNALEALDGGSPEAARFWPAYVQRWTWWNHLRTVCALLASVLLTAAVSAS